MKNTGNFNNGLFFAFLTAITSGFAIFISSFALKTFKDPFVFTILKNVIVAALLVSLIGFLGKWKKLSGVSRKNWIYLLLIGIIGGSIPFLLFFKGLSMSSALAGAFIHKSLFIWVSIMAVVFLKEKISRLQWAALGVLIGGNFLLGAFNSFSFGKGEAMIFLATLLWSAEYVIAKKVLKDVDSDILAWSRMFFGSLILLVYLVIMGKFGSIFTINHQQIFWVTLSSVFLLAYVLFWYRALKAAPASVVSSILVLGSPITTLLSVFFVSAFKYNFSQFGGVVLITAGILMFLHFGLKTQAQDLAKVSRIKA